MAAMLDCIECPGISNSVFACLKTPQRECVARLAVPHVYLRGQTIFYEGNHSLAVYCVRAGMVKLSRQHNHGDQTTVGMRTRGDLFGYRAVLADLPYGISAEAIERSVVCAIAREDFLALIGQSHDLATALLRRLAREFHFTEELLAERGAEPVLKRTARILLRVASEGSVGIGGGGSIGIPTRRSELALLLGTTPETLSRTLHDLAERGVLDVDRDSIRVRDLDRLAALTE